MNKKLLSAAVVMSLAAGIQAATITKFGVSPAGFFVPGSPPPVGNTPGSGGVFNYNVAVAQITPAELAGGTLVGVSYTFKTGTYAFGNIANSTATYTILWGIQPSSNLQVTSPNVNGTLYPAGPLASTTVSGDGTTPGPAYITPQSILVGGPTSDTLAGYVGTGTRDWNILSQGFSGVAGPAGSVSQAQPGLKQGTGVTVTYTYQPSDVPEASTYAAGAVLLLGAGWVARRRMAV